MTQKKLEIIGPYTPEHEGPYVWGNSELLPCTVHAVVQGRAFVTSKCVAAPFITAVENIHNAREAPVAREFWIVGKVGDAIHFRFNNSAAAMDFWRNCADQTEIIHVREVLPGEGA
ncbi:hypothetical protein [Acetobacter fabarum]|uniref:hypothetical protein n=1 Tax=Acetobacter fabarum TaxID=483199 RepID=UPI0039EA5616